MEEMKKEGNVCGPGGCGGSCGCGGGCSGGKCGCMHHKIPSILIVLVGLVFLLKALGMMGAGTADVAWPVLVILFGVMKLSGNKCKCC